MMDGYKMPAVTPGDTVVFRKRPGLPERALIVTEVAGRTIAGMVQVSGGTIFEPFVNHISDPEVTREGRQEPAPTWRLPDWRVQLDEMWAWYQSVKDSESRYTADSTALANALIAEGVRDEGEIRKRTGLHWKVVEKLIREYEAKLEESTA